MACSSLPAETIKQTLRIPDLVRLHSHACRLLIHLESQGAVSVMLFGLVGLSGLQMRHLFRTQIHAIDGKLYIFLELRAANSVV